MGLDNAITLELNKETQQSKWLNMIMDKNNDVIYYRKCWNIRDAILEAIGISKYNQEACIGIADNDIKAIIKVLKRINNRRTWNNNFWNYSGRVFINLWIDVIKLRLLLFYLKHINKEFYRQGNMIYFYDSY